MPVTHARVVMSDACTTAGAKLAVKVSTKVEAVTRDCECEQDCAVNDTPALLTPRLSEGPRLAFSKCFSFVRPFLSLDEPRFFYPPVCWLLGDRDVHDVDADG